MALECGLFCLYGALVSGLDGDRVRACLLSDKDVDGSFALEKPGYPGQRLVVPVQVPRLLKPRHPLSPAGSHGILKYALTSWSGSTLQDFPCTVPLVPSALLALAQ